MTAAPKRNARRLVGKAPQFEVAELRLTPDDILVLRYKGKLTQQGAEQLGQMAFAAGAQRVMVIDESIDLEIVRQQLNPPAAKPSIPGLILPG